MVKHMIEKRGTNNYPINGSNRIVDAYNTIIF